MKYVSAAAACLLIVAPGAQATSSTGGARALAARIHQPRVMAKQQRHTVRQRKVKITRALKHGMHGRAIRKLQRALKINASGKFDRKTERAVVGFQKHRRLLVDGIAGAQTLSALKIEHHIALSAGPRAHMSSILQKIAACESGGNPSAVSANGMYRGKYQFSRGTWSGVGGSGDPAAASEAEQDMRAQLLLNRSGTSSWPSCGR